MVANLDGVQAVLFDGVCNLCSTSVNFIIDRDPHGRFKFASLQSKAAKSLLEARGVYGALPDSIVFIDGDDVYVESTAALRIARGLSGGWPVLYAGIIFPRFVRDAVYRLIARNRYRWFGKSDSCRMPTPSDRERFLAEPEPA